MALTRKKVPVVRKDVAKGAASGGAEVRKGESQLTEALAESPVVSEDEDLKQMADYYRNGHYEATPGELGTLSVERILPSKTLTEWVEQPASIRVYGKGTGRPNTGENKNEKKERDFIPPYTKFILEGINEGHSERSQIVETFGEFYVFFYGERPPIYNFRGTLINSKNANWLADFHYYYENHIRGTKCVERNARIVMTYGGRQIEGYLLAINTQTDASNEMAVPVTMQVVVTSRNNVSFSDDFGEEAEEIEALLDAIAGKEGKGLSDNLVSEAWNHTKGSLNQTRAASDAFFSQPTQFATA